MADVRDPVGVGLEHGRTTSPQSAAATDSDLRAAARELQSAGADPTVVHRSFSAQVMVSGALFVAFVIVLVVSVIWVSENSKHPLVQLNPSSPATSASTTSPTAAYGPIPLPAGTPALPPPPVDIPHRYRRRRPPRACRDPHACTAPAAATPTTAPLFSRACSQADSARAIYRRGQCRTRSSLQVR